MLATTEAVGIIEYAFFFIPAIIAAITAALPGASAGAATGAGVAAATGAATAGATGGTVAGATGGALASSLAPAAATTLSTIPAGTGALLAPAAASTALTGPIAAAPTTAGALGGAGGGALTIPSAAGAAAPSGGGGVGALGGLAAEEGAKAGALSSTPFSFSQGGVFGSAAGPQSIAAPSGGVAPTVTPAVPSALTPSSGVGVGGSAGAPTAGAELTLSQILAGSPAEFGATEGTVLVAGGEGSGKGIPGALGSQSLTQVSPAGSLPAGQSPIPGLGGAGGKGIGGAAAGKGAIAGQTGPLTGESIAATLGKATGSTGATQGVAKAAFPGGAQQRAPQPIIQKRPRSSKLPEQVARQQQAQQQFAQLLELIKAKSGGSGRGIAGIG